MKMDDEANLECKEDKTTKDLENQNSSIETEDREKSK